MVMIKGQLDPGFLKKASRYINNDFETVLAELLQNSRRAGATEVHINILGNEITGDAEIKYTDNGGGVASFQSLATLGRSDWIDDVQEDEDPAGAGIFSLYGRNPIIASGKYAVCLSDKLLSGGEEMVFTREPVKGFQITWTEPKSVINPGIAVHRLSAYFPVKVTFTCNGEAEEVTQQDMLGEECVISKQVPELGIEIGLCRRNRFLYCSSRNGLILFKGFSVCSDFLEELIRSYSFLDVVPVVDIKNVKSISPVLPDRKDLRSGPGYSENLEKVKQEVEKLLWMYIRQLPAKDNEHMLVYGYGQYKRAAEAGLELPTPTIKYTLRDSADYGTGPYEYSSLESFRKMMAEDDYILVRNQIAVSNTAIYDAFNCVMLSDGLYAYPFIQALGVVYSWDIVEEDSIDSAAVDMDKIAESYKSPVVRLFGSTGNVVKTIKAPVSVFPLDGCSCWSSIDDLQIVRGTEAVDLPAGELADLHFQIMSMWVPYEDYECDSYDTQKEVICDELEAYLHSVFGGSTADGIRLKLEQALRNLWVPCSRVEARVVIDRNTYPRLAVEITELVE